MCPLLPKTRTSRWKLPEPVLLVFSLKQENTIIPVSIKKEPAYFVRDFLCIHHMILITRES